MIKGAPKCSVNTCINIQQAKGFCGAHYYRCKKYGNPRANIPLKPRNIFKGTKCIIADCDLDAKTHYMCSKHYTRKHRLGDANVPVRKISGKRQRRYTDWAGYVHVYNPNGGNGILEHRKIMEAHLDRKLLRHEVAHHLNGDKQDNRLENLELWSKSHPYRILMAKEWKTKLNGLWSF